MEEEPRSRLARLIGERRRELRLSERQAATAAGVARNTWASAEEGAKALSEKTTAGIEAALQWPPGSIELILAGGHPLLPVGHIPPNRRGQLVETVPVQRASLPRDFDLSGEIDKIMRLEIPSAQKLKLASQITDLYEQAQAERRAADR